MLKQKSRCQWVNLGDQNSRYFFNMLQQRKAKNCITQLPLANGVVCSDQEEIKKAILNHFIDFLGTSQVRSGNFDISIFQDRLVSVTDWDSLCSIPSKEEINEALWSINDNKSLGPDGFNSFFVKKAWSIVGKEICMVVQDFFQNGKMLKQTNSTAITLIPKVICPQSLNDFRPISCCNVIYKMISKILSGRLRGILTDIIQLNQSAFIPGRKIDDNVLLAHELLQGYHRNKYGCCALKVDLQKTYDSVSWDFLEEVMLAFRFPAYFIQLVMNFVKSSMFSIIINGQMEGFFLGEERIETR